MLVLVVDNLGENVLFTEVAIDKDKDVINLIGTKPDVMSGRGVEVLRPLAEPLFSAGTTCTDLLPSTERHLCGDCGAGWDSRS